MKMSKILLAAATFVLLSGPLSTHANIIYTWTGTCLTAGPGPLCTGEAAMLVVTTDAYVPGEVWFVFEHPTTLVLLEALYADSNVTIDFAARFNTPNGNAFMLPASPSEGGFFSIEASQFRSNTIGDWVAGGENVFPQDSPNCHPAFICGYQARGVNGVWTRVPEPSTLALLAVGLMGVGAASRRKLSGSAS